MKVQDPDGRTWRVSRRWVPWRRRLRDVDAAPDVPVEALGDDPVSAVLGVVLFVLLIPFVVLVLVAGIELLVLMLVLPFAVLGRVLLGRHWTVEARLDWKPVWEEPSGGWRESGRRVHSVADEIRRGDHPAVLTERT